jgi:hypothetical protein
MFGSAGGIGGVPAPHLHTPEVTGIAGRIYGRVPAERYS